MDSLPTGESQTTHHSPLTTHRSPLTNQGRRWFLFGGLVAAVLALGAGAWLHWRRVEADRTRQQAIHLAKKGRFEEAEPQLRAALLRDANDVEVLKALALGLLGSERLDEAELPLTHWCDLRPAEAQPYRLRMHLRHQTASQGKTEAEQQRLEELALADGRHALELDPDDDSTAQNVVWLCLAAGRFEEADRWCRRCREQRPDDPWLLYLQARVCQARGENDQAGALLDALLGDQPQFTRGLLLRAVLYAEADEPDKAIPLLRQVIARDRAHQQEARYHLSLALARTGHTEEAQQVMAEVQRDNLEQLVARTGHADSPAVQIRRAELLLNAGQAREALSLLQTILEEDPRHAGAHFLLASFYEKQGELQKAAEHRRRAEAGQGDKVTR
jgi:tetratricopeptide (TPR) repeat protein